MCGFPRILGWEIRGRVVRLPGMNFRPATSMTLVVLATAIGVATLGASSAQAMGRCDRTMVGIGCQVQYEPYITKVDTMYFGVRNNYGEAGVRNLVHTDRGWLDGTNDVTKRTWHGHLGRRAWRGRYKLWRACVLAWRPHFACTGWVWQGPPPFGP
jgi:hypothetical protein